MQIKSLLNPVPGSAWPPLRCPVGSGTPSGRVHGHWREGDAAAEGDVGARTVS